MAEVGVRKVVINSCFGGFGLSESAIRRYAEIKSIALDDREAIYGIARDDPALVQVVEELGSAAGDSGTYSIDMGPPDKHLVLHDLVTVWGVLCYRTSVFLGADQVSEVLRPVQDGDRA